MNKTKIVATIGPSNCSYEKLKELVKAGMNVARLNLNHADYDFCTEVVENINKINDELNTSIATMFDIRSENIKLGEFDNDEAYLEEGTKIRLYINEVIGDSTKFSIYADNIIEEVNYDSIIKIDNGHIELQVIDKESDYLLCKVLNGGFITSKCNVFIPDYKPSTPFLTKEAKDDILLANTLGVDFLALSNVSTNEDVLEINDLLINIGNDHIGIISKIENESAVESIDEIIKVSDGVTIARGTLGIELPMERVPGIQKSIINKCHLAGKISLVSTEMMTSMENDLIPTRAEVSDVANAVLDGCDAVILTGETMLGKHPVETIEMMGKIISTAEQDIDYLGFMDRAVRTEAKDTTGMISHSVSYNSHVLNCKAIVAPTMSGYTARKISRFRPKCPIIALSPDLLVCRSLALNFGICPVKIGEVKTLDKIIDLSKKIADEYLDINSGDKLIITGGYPFKEVKHTNFMKIEEI